MKIEIPPIVKPIDLGDYAEELRGLVLYVWVNCPRSFRDSYWALIAESEIAMAAMKHAPNGEAAKAINDVSARISAWVSELWSQAANPMSPDDVTALANSDTDPALYGWALNRSWAMIGEHREQTKKK